MSSPIDHGHIPVLVSEVIERLNPGSAVAMLDCTIGRGGHAAELLDRAGPQAQLLGLDLDEQNLHAAVKRLATYGQRVQLRQTSFARFDDALKQSGLGQVDIIFADLGLSSNQLADASRGFSFDADGPLDMRLDTTQSTTATELVNALPERELADLLWQYGQERFSRRIAKRICQVRHHGRITTTSALANAVCSAVKVDPASRRSKIHPATRTFLALRIAVNHELDNLEAMLTKAPEHLRPGGRMGVISFHSLEDGLVKRDFRQRKKEGVYRILTPRPVTPGQLERRSNPRSRSAKLRVAERTEQPMSKMGDLGSAGKARGS
jgi:16S rRNA (cytosine1402-N4)-methyltransferase